MRLAAFICLLGFNTIVFGQQSDILFVINESFPVSHSRISYKIIDKSEFHPDSISQGILNNLLEFTFLNVDTNHYKLERMLVSEIGVDPEALYRFNDFESNSSPFSKPNFSELHPYIDQIYDYIVFINKVDIIKEMRHSKLRFWFSVFSGTGTELISSKHTARYDLSGGMSAFELLENLHKPAEDFEERILNLLDLHSIEGRVGGSYENSSYYGYYKCWKPGLITLINGDSLKGQVRYIDPYKISFRREESSEPRMFLSNQVSHIRIGDSYYRSLFIHQIPGNLGKHAILRVLNEGKVSLYRLGENEMSKFFILGEDKEQIRVHLTPDKKKVTNSKKVAVFFEDDPQSAKKIYARDFGIRDLQKLVFLYNQ